ncbi:MAG: hypothetical protein Ct9H300mP28_10620 [Pseudomonadota bacterium]|nr:MAG: hypothetical protein Ct9H300mP28_10620 [Pseudomonadota bacterium]
MVKILLKINESLQEDQADALAVALTHAHLWRAQNNCYNMNYFFMIAYLEGHILRSEDNLIVLKTSANVGYAVYVPSQISVKYSPEEFLSLHIHSNYREDDISLYGFQNLGKKRAV